MREMVPYATQELHRRLSVATPSRRASAKHAA